MSRATMPSSVVVLAALAVAHMLAPRAYAQTEVLPQDAGLDRLAREIERLAPLAGGTVGVAAVHLETGREVYFNGDVPFPMASTYKIPIAVQLLTRVDGGERSLDEMIEIEPADLHPGSGTLSRLFNDPGVALSLHNLMELMLLISDNSATDLTLRAAGGGAAVTERMRALGIEDIRVDRPTSLLIADYGGVEGAPQDGRIDPDAYRVLSRRVSPEARRAANERFSTDPRDNATPRAMARLLASIWTEQALSPESTELFLDAMLRVETGTSRIKGLLPPGTDVAHKTGSIGGTTNDVGIVYLPETAGHVVTVVFVKESERPTATRESAIAQISRAVYDFFLFDPGE